MKRVFDSLCLHAVVSTLQGWRGAKVQKIWAVDSQTIAMELYQRQPGHLHLSWDAELARLVLGHRRPPKSEDPVGFAQELRRRLEDGRFLGVEQVGLDRMVALNFQSEGELWTLVGELMGKHSNWVLIDGSDRMVAAGKWVGARSSKRPVLAGQKYQPPPFDRKPPLTECTDPAQARDYEGWSPTIQTILDTEGRPGLERIQRAFSRQSFDPVQVGSAVYPISLPFAEARRIEDYPDAAAFAFEAARTQRLIDQRRTSLLQRLERTILAREVALNDLEQAADGARRAREVQEMGELILAYQGQIKPQDSELLAWDYAGTEVRIPLKADLTPVENANRYFDKAKRAKDRAEGVAHQQQRLEADYRAILDHRTAVLRAETPRELADLEATAETRRWVHTQAPPAKKEDRPYQGKAVREFLGPKNYKILYGDNAEANDYLTLRVAKPNDWWLHVRGGPSAHVVIQTMNQPDRVPPEVLRIAALIAAKQSPSKHSSYVSVDYTLKKYVRRPKGSAPGLAVYTHEKTLHVDPTSETLNR